MVRFLKFIMQSIGSLFVSDSNKEFRKLKEFISN